MGTIILIIGIVVLFVLIGLWVNKLDQKEKERYKNLSLEDKLKEKSIQYFLPPMISPVNRSPLELNKTVDAQDQEFEKLIREYFSTELIQSFRTEAIDALGLDVSELTAISPIHFEDYYYDWEEVERKMSLWLSFSTGGKVNRDDVFKRDDNVLLGIGYDKKLRSSAYQVTWIFPTLKRLSVYQKIFYLHKKETEETTRMFVWKHITSITATQNTIKTEGKAEKVDIFKIVVPGDEFICTMNTTEYTKRAIQAMKAVWTSNVE